MVGGGVSISWERGSHGGEKSRCCWIEIGMRSFCNAFANQKIVRGSMVGALRVEFDCVLKRQEDPSSSCMGEDA